MAPIEGGMALLPPAVTKNISDKFYDRRKLAALEVEQMVRTLCVAGDREAIADLVDTLAGSYALSAKSNARKGGLLCLAAAAVGLASTPGDAGAGLASALVPHLVPPILRSFTDPDPRLRYYALEALYNVAKSTRGALLGAFAEVFDSLFRVCSDADPSVQNAAAFCNNLVKDVVAEEDGFQLAAFVPQLAACLGVDESPHTRQFLLGWVALLDGLPGQDLTPHLPLLLPGIMVMLADPAPEIAAAATRILADLEADFLPEPRGARSGAGLTQLGEPAGAGTSGPTPAPPRAPSATAQTSGRRADDGVDGEVAGVLAHVLAAACGPGPPLGGGLTPSADRVPGALAVALAALRWLNRLLAQYADGGDAGAAPPLNSGSWQPVAPQQQPQQQQQARTALHAGVAVPALPGPAAAAVASAASPKQLAGSWEAGDGTGANQRSLPASASAPALGVGGPGSSAPRLPGSMLAQFPAMLEAVLLSLGSPWLDILPHARALNEELLRVVSLNLPAAPATARAAAAAFLNAGIGPGTPSSTGSPASAGAAPARGTGRWAFAGSWPTPGVASPGGGPSPCPGTSPVGNRAGGASSLSSGGGPGLSSSTAQAPLAPTPGPAATLDAAALLASAIAALESSSEAVKLAALQWLPVLLRASPADAGEALLRALTDALGAGSASVAARALRVLGDIARRGQRAQRGVLIEVLAGFRGAAGAKLLQRRGVLIVQGLAERLGGLSVLVALSELAAEDADAGFGAAIIQALNLLLLANPALKSVRSLLAQARYDAEAAAVMASLHRVWARSSAAALSLTFLAQAYELAVGMLEVMALPAVALRAETAIEACQLVSLLESPAFAGLRLRLLAPGQYPALHHAAHALLMLLPQGDAFATLATRLAALPRAWPGPGFWPAPPVPGPASNGAASAPSASQGAASGQQAGTAPAGTSTGSIPVPASTSGGSALSAFMGRKSSRRGGESGGATAPPDGGRGTALPEDALLANFRQVQEELAEAVGAQPLMSPRARDIWQ